MKSIVWALAGVAVGIISAYLVLIISPVFLWIQNDVWKTSLVAGSEQADIYTRAIVAKNYLYVLNRSEAIYFIADSDGKKKLDRKCDYRLVGRDLPARWWSITVYGEDNFLIPNDYGIYSVTSANVVRMAKTGRFTSRRIQGERTDSVNRRWWFLHNSQTLQPRSDSIRED